MRQPDFTAKTSGFTIIELVIAVAVFALILVGVGTLFQGTSEATDYLTRSTEMDRSIQQALHEMTQDLKSAPMSMTTIDSTDPDHDSVVVQIPNPDALDVSDWGYYDEFNVFRTDWACQYLVDGSDLVRRRLDGSFGAVGPDQLICSGVDTTFDSGSGPERGFEIAPVGSLLNFSLRIVETTSDGTVYRRSAITTILQEQ